MIAGHPILYKCDPCGAIAEGFTLVLPKGWKIRAWQKGILDLPTRREPPRRRHYCSQGCWHNDTEACRKDSEDWHSAVDEPFQKATKEAA